MTRAGQRTDTWLAGGGVVDFSGSVVAWTFGSLGLWGPTAGDSEDWIAPLSRTPRRVVVLEWTQSSSITRSLIELELPSMSIRLSWWPTLSALP